MKLAVACTLAVLISTIASIASLHHGPIAGLAPLTGYGAALIWHAHRYHTKDWNRD